MLTGVSPGWLRRERAWRQAQEIEQSLLGGPGLCKPDWGSSNEHAWCSHRPQWGQSWNPEGEHLAQNKEGTLTSRAAPQWRGARK